MPAFSTSIRTALVAIGAFALTASLFVGSFSADPQVRSAVEMIA